MAQIAPIQAFHEPESLDQCLDMLAKEGARALVIAGGQSIMPILKTRGLRPHVLISLARIEDLRVLDATGSRDGTLIMGAMCRHRDIWNDPGIARNWSALSDAAACVGDRQIQNRGTIGGNLAFGTVLTDMKQVAMCLDARLQIAGPNGERSASALELFADIDRTMLQPGELLKAVHFPFLGKGAGSAYGKYGITANGRPVVGVAAMVKADPDGVCTDARIVVGGLVPCPNVARYSAQLLVGKVLDADTIGAAADAVSEEVKPQSDSRATSSYRRRLISVYGRQVLELARTRAEMDCD